MDTHQTCCHEQGHDATGTAGPLPVAGASSAAACCDTDGPGAEGDNTHRPDQAPFRASADAQCSQHISLRVLLHLADIQAVQVTT